MSKRRWRIPNASNTAYIGCALLIGLLTATAQGFPVGGAAWLGATMGTGLGGALFGLLYRLFRPTSIPKWMFYWALVSLVVNGGAAHK